MAQVPTLETADVERSLGVHGFKLKRIRGSHRQWEGRKPDGTRTVITVDENDAPFTKKSRTLKSIIKHSGIPRRDFYRDAGKPL